MITKAEVIDILVQHRLINRPNNKRRVVVQLGKYGDILNILPALRVMSQECGEPINMMVAQEFLVVVKDLSYVRPIIFDGHFFEGFQEALRMADGLFDDVVVAQVCGKGLHYAPVERNFNREAWHRIGMGDRFHCSKLVMDNRNFQYEDWLADTHMAGPRPTVLVNLHGTSSPFPAGDAMFHHLRRAMPDVRFLDLSNFTANRIQSLLGLYDRAIGLITCDTATLHLARSHPIPVIAFCREGWQGTDPIGNIVFKCTYEQAWQHLDALPSFINRFNGAHPKIIHLQQDYVSGNANTQRRESLAAGSWVTHYGRGGIVPMKFKPENYPNAKSVGDHIDAPDIKSVLDHFVLAYPDDIVVISNNDVCAMPNVEWEIRAGVNRYGCFYSHRIDVDEVKLPLVDVAGEEYPGADLFAFSRDWWVKHRDSVPNLFMGFEGWDFVAKCLMVRSGFVKGKPCIVHERHAESHWKNNNDRPGQLHNRRTCIAWAKQFHAEEYLINGGRSDFLFREI